MEGGGLEGGRRGRKGKGTEGERGRRKGCWRGVVRRLPPRSVFFFALLEELRVVIRCGTYFLAVGERWKSIRDHPKHTRMLQAKEKVLPHEQEVVSRWPPIGKAADAHLTIDAA